MILRDVGPRDPTQSYAIFRGFHGKVLAKVLAIIHRCFWPSHKCVSHASRRLIQRLKIDARGFDIFVSKHGLDTSYRYLPVGGMLPAARRTSISTKVDRSLLPGAVVCSAFMVSKKANKHLKTSGTTGHFPSPIL